MDVFPSLFARNCAFFPPRCCYSAPVVLSRGHLHENKVGKTGGSRNSASLPLQLELLSRPELPAKNQVQGMYVCVRDRKKERGGMSLCIFKLKCIRTAFSPWAQICVVLRPKDPMPAQSVELLEASNTSAVASSSTQLAPCMVAITSSFAWELEQQIHFALHPSPL